MKQMKLFSLLVLSLFAFNANAYQTEVDLNFKTNTQLLQLRNGIWAWDWHAEFYQDLYKTEKAGVFEYGLIYQGREGDNLEWHQLNWKSPKLGDRVKWWTTLKVNYIPDRSVGPKGFGFHTRFWNQIRIKDGLRLTTFVEPRWQDIEDVSNDRTLDLDYFGHKSRMTLDKDFGRNTLHVGVTKYGNSARKWNLETQWVVMWTIRL